MRLLSANVFIFMQIREHSILFQKDGVDEFAKDLVEDFGMVVTEITPDGASAKDVESNDWKDEDGEDVYIPQRICLKKSSVSIKMALSGEHGSFYKKITPFLDYLTSNTSNSENGLMLHSSYIGKGFANCYFNEMSTQDFYKSGNEEICEFTIKFDCYKPNKKVIYTYKPTSQKYILQVE